MMMMMMMREPTEEVGIKMSGALFMPHEHVALNSTVCFMNQTVVQFSDVPSTRVGVWDDLLTEAS